MNERLKKLRKTLDLTQQEFADRLQIKRNTVATYEAGKSNPSDAAVSLINVNEDWLRTGEGEMFIQMTRDEEIAAFVAKALRTEEDSFKKRFIAMLSALDESDWESLEKIALLLVDKKEQDKPTP